MFNREDNVIPFIGRQIGQSQKDQPMTRAGGTFLMKDPEGPAPDEMFWTCEKCGLIAPRALPTGRWIKRSCACQIAARQTDKAHQDHVEWVRKARVRTYGGWLGERWEDKEIVDEMCSKTFTSFEKQRDPMAYKKAWEFAQDPRGNLLLCGGYGTGKTHLEAAILNFLREVGMLLPDGERKPIGGLFTSAPQFFRAYNDAMNAADKTRFITMTDQAIGTPLLVIDDVDKVTPTDFRQDTYFLILDERYKAKRPTILSTNRQETLGEYVGEAVAFSRLMRKLTVIKMTGDDYRLEEEF
jgi:DNA replication protein DnaC